MQLKEHRLKSQSQLSAVRLCFDVPGPQHPLNLPSPVTWQFALTTDLQSYMYTDVILT